MRIQESSPSRPLPRFMALGSFVVVVLVWNLYYSTQGVLQFQYVLSKDLSLPAMVNLSTLDSHQVAINTSDTDGSTSPTQTPMPFYSPNISKHFLDLVASANATHHPRAWPDPNGKKVFLNYLVHIPKTGTSFALTTLSKLVFTSAEWKYYRDVLRKRTYRPCSAATIKPWNFQAKYRHVYRTDTCTLWMSEQPPSGNSQNNYIILRDPKTHVLSQYFHCKESKDHAKLAHRMPSNVTFWLQTWANVLAKVPTAEQTAIDFGCYRPINLQSWYAGNPVSLQDFQKRFLVVGDSSQMSLSICAIAIEYNGFVPSPCNCSHEEAEQGPNQRPADGTVTIVQKESYDLKRSSHGVKHHGDTYPTTPDQDALIANLTDKDQVLYGYARTLLAKKIEELQEKYQVKICRKMGPIIK